MLVDDFLRVFDDLAVRTEYAYFIFCVEKPLFTNTVMMPQKAVINTGKSNEFLGSACNCRLNGLCLQISVGTVVLHCLESYDPEHRTWIFF